MEMARAFHDALLRSGVEPGTTFVGEEWTDRVMVACNITHPQSIKGYTDAGRAQRLWTVEGGLGRGNKKAITILAKPRLDEAAVDPVEQLLA